MDNAKLPFKLTGAADVIAHLKTVLKELRFANRCATHHAKARSMTGLCHDRAQRCHLPLLQTPNAWRCSSPAWSTFTGPASAQLLEDAGCEVIVPPGQTCCGQPGYNSGDRAAAINIARRVIEMLEPFDWVVVPSGSCGGMIRKHYPELFADDADWAARAKTVAGKTYELTAFLTHVLGVKSVSAQFPAHATYHDSCSALRELGLRSEPRQLLNSVVGLTITELKERDACCGFGGTFAVKYPDISNAIVEKKTADVTGTGANLLISADMGCLMNMAGKLKREGSAVQVRHVAEVLAGMVDLPAIGEGPRT